MSISTGSGSIAQQTDLCGENVFRSQFAWASTTVAADRWDGRAYLV